MNIQTLKDLFDNHKEKQLYHRYITNTHIQPLLKILKDKMVIGVIGASVLEKPIYGIKIGYGTKRILMWSQMHGNESTTTKALFDMLNTLSDNNAISNCILQSCTIYIIPILNPDGAEAYTRVNANQVDLNRDAQTLTQPESNLLRTIFGDFKPHYCFNLHGQRTIFGAGNQNHPATVSFLAPAQDEDCTVTDNRKIAMEIIGAMNSVLQTVIPNQVGVYDDVFNINCVGDTFQSLNVPTLLFEAGHYQNDYAREKTREYIYMSLLTSIKYISDNEVRGNHYHPYLEIPENEKCFFDIIIRNAKVDPNTNEDILDIGILYQEVLKDGIVEFIPKIEKIENLDGFFGHKEIDAKGNVVHEVSDSPVKIGNENVCVIMNNENITLLLK